MTPSRPVLREWISANAQVVLMATLTDCVMRREACPDDQYWLLLRGAWSDRSELGKSTIYVAESVHYHPVTPCVRRALADTLSVGVRLFRDAPLRSEGGVRRTGFEKVLWSFARAVSADAFPGEDALDEAVLPLFDARPSEGEARFPRWLAGVRDRLHDESLPTPLAELGASVGVSPNHLSATFTRHYGRSISRYRRELALRRALRRLASPDGAPGEAAIEGGFYDQAHFTRTCRRDLGLTPGQIGRLLRDAPS